MVRVELPLYLPGWAYLAMRNFKRKVRALAPPAVNLWGDREIEWSFVVSRLPEGPGTLLDFGASDGLLSITAAQRGFEVLALDLGPERFPWKHPRVKFLRGNLLEIQLPRRSFDVVLNCSSVEHVGLPGRYGVDVAESDGDLRAMRRFYEILNASGVMLMTIPCGQDAVIVPWHRVYGETRLPKLLAGFEIQEQSYWVKHADNRWSPCEREEALAFRPGQHPKDPSLCSYALGCFVLRVASSFGENREERG